MRFTESLYYEVVHRFMSSLQGEVNLHEFFPDLGNKTGPWLAVRRLIGCREDALPAVLEAVRAFITEEPAISEIVQKLTVNHLSTAIHDTSSEGHGDADHFAAAAVTNVMDDIGRVVETSLLSALR